MATNAGSGAELRTLPRTLAGATILQIVAALRDTSQARTTIRVAHALVQAGARAIVAGEGGELINELKGFGGEWLPFAGTSVNRTKLKTNIEVLDKFVAAEGVHIIHAKTAGAAWSALIATKRNSIDLITELPDLPRRQMWFASFYFGALSRGDRVICHSLYNARPMIARHRIPIERVRVIPRSIDLARFNSANVPLERVTALRKAWGIPSGTRIALVPAPIAPGNGHLVLAQAARMLHGSGLRGVTFVLAGDDRRYRRFVRRFWAAVQELGVDALFRAVGHHTDMPPVYAASDLVILPYTSEPVYGRAVAEAQAMARPVVASALGPLPDYMLTPPRAAEDRRTGWQVKPGSPERLAEAIASALTLERTSYRALGMRARQFAEYMFAPERAVTVSLEIYASVLKSKE
jgi:glycosyltransferase involved in cell wall biosynthesis